MTQFYDSSLMQCRYAARKMLASFIRENEEHRAYKERRMQHVVRGSATVSKLQCHFSH